MKDQDFNLCIEERNMVGKIVSIAFLPDHIFWKFLSLYEVNKTKENEYEITKQIVC